MPHFWLDRSKLIEKKKPDLEAPSTHLRCRNAPQTTSISTKFISQIVDDCIF